MNITASRVLRGTSRLLGKLSHESKTIRRCFAWTDAKARSHDRSGNIHNWWNVLAAVWRHSNIRAGLAIHGLAVPSLQQSWANNNINRVCRHLLLKLMNHVGCFSSNLTNSRKMGMPVRVMAVPMTHSQNALTKDNTRMNTQIKQKRIGSTMLSWK